MDSLTLASGDSTYSEINKSPKNDIESSTLDSLKTDQEEITPQVIDENEAKLKDRISQCRSIIESLKSELNQEKVKFEKESKGPSVPDDFNRMPEYSGINNEVSTSRYMGDFHTYNSTRYSSCIDRKLCCDENLMEYEKQLKKYQNTLNMAQIEKKNAIRKQMLTKAYRLKLLEVENQCNIELLRVKQSLQCLEPLKLIADKWKNSSENSTYDCANFELMPRYPELSASSSSDIIPSKEFSLKAVTVQSRDPAIDDYNPSEC